MTILFEWVETHKLDLVDIASWYNSAYWIQDRAFFTAQLQVGNGLNLTSKMRPTMTLPPPKAREQKTHFLEKQVAVPVPVFLEKHFFWRKPFGKG